MFAFIQGLANNVFLHPQIAQLLIQFLQLLSPVMVIRLKPGNTAAQKIAGKGKENSDRQAGQPYRLPGAAGTRCQFPRLGVGGQ